MSKKDQKPLDEQDTGNILEFTDEQGNIEQFEFLDMISHKGADYAVLLPVTDDENEPASVYIFEVIEEIDSDTDTYVGIESQELVDEIYAVFMEKHKDDFNFTD